MLSVVPHRKLWYIISGIFVIAAIVPILIWRFNFGIDFTGGSLIEFDFNDGRPLVTEIERDFNELGATRVKVQTAGDRGMIIRSAFLSTSTHRAIVEKFAGQAREARYEAIGPSIGQELARKTVIGVILALMGIVAYVAWVFRKASRDISAWCYGVVALISMAHDVIIPMGVFAILGYFRNIEIDAPFIAAVLTILGYSINDTIIVLDRVRENVLSAHSEPFADVVERSVRQSFARSVNTTLTTILALLAIIVFGGASVRYFALALAIGIGVGAYSSIFIAAPLLVTWHNHKNRRVEV
ncbi:MAG: protein translocase subunit SecF [Candidatus Uhrbacteria bacterium]